MQKIPAAQSTSNSCLLGHVLLHAQRTLSCLWCLRGPWGGPRLWEGLLCAVHITQRWSCQLSIGHVQETRWKASIFILQWSLMYKISCQRELARGKRDSSTWGKNNIPISLFSWAWAGIQPCWGTQPSPGNTPMVVSDCGEGHSCLLPEAWGWWAPCKTMAVCSHLIKMHMIVKRALPWFWADFPPVWRRLCPLSWKWGELSSQVSETGTGGKSFAWLK